MKKVMITLMMVAATKTSNFSKTTNILSNSLI